MPPPLPKGQRYAPVDPSPAHLLPVPGAPASFTDPVPEVLAPSSPAPPAAFPEASGTTLTTPGFIYPAPGPTTFDFLYQQLLKAAFPGTANTWTATQDYTGVAGPLTTRTITDMGGGGDSPALRPNFVEYNHYTTLPTVAGVGGSLLWNAKDSAGTKTPIGMIGAEITGATPGAVDGTVYFCCEHQGQLCEVLRIRGQLGQDATADATSVTGFLGGEVYARTYLRIQGRFGLGVTPVGVQTLPAAASDPTTTQALANALRAAMIAFGFGV